MGGAQGAANDARRKADINQLAKAVMIYKTNNPEAVLPVSCVVGVDCPAEVFGDAVALRDPNGSGYVFTSDGKDYVVSAVLSDNTGYEFDSVTGSYSKVSSVNGTCGTAVRNFASGDTSYGSYTQCSSGTPSNTAFPAEGGSESWTCSGTNGGNASATCTATRSAAAFCSVSAHYDTTKTVGSDTLWCDNYGHIWSNVRSTGTDRNTAVSMCSSLSYGGYGAGSWTLPVNNLTSPYLENCYNTPTCLASSGYNTFWSASTFGSDCCSFEYMPNGMGTNEGCFGCMISYYVRCMLQ
ncbi:MAG: hypothetical protein PHW52_02115 [Candidatus Pacebacteria bacterium]|nr:hypothetical protein [Candidatus Paceibacterota bacterium]